jgi:cation transport ATPase
MKGILSKIFGIAGGGVADKISKIIDRHSFSKEEKANFEKEMEEIFISAEAEQQRNVSERWKADMTSDNNLSKSVRPLMLMFTIVSTIILIFIDSGFVSFEVADEWKDLLKTLLITIVAAYFGGRSYEKSQSINMKK